MGEMAHQVDTVIAARRAQLPAIQAEIAGWHRVDDAAVALARTVAGLSWDPATPRHVAAHLGQLRIAEVRPSITAAIESLQRAESRIGRGTVCIGVSGAARTGKSTLLQSLSGLTDAWLPRGTGTSVTAVRSRVLHSPGRHRAVLELHTFGTFRAAHLQPGHVAAGLGEAPADIEAFRAASYPAVADRTSERGAQLARLSEMQAALWSYEGLLDRQGRALELSGDELDRLREYVAYPTDERAGPRPAARRYLAVREARIECAFPRADLAGIAMVDLPGLGGTASVQRHHLTGLRHDVDFVLLVKRMASAAMDGDEADDAALALLDEARGFVSRRGDFVFVVLNTDAGVSSRADGRRDDVPHPLRTGRGQARQLRVLAVDGKDPADVSARLLRPVLRHLADRLPVMDAEVFAGMRGLTGAVRDELIGLAVEAKAVLRQVCGSSADGAGDLYRRADELYANIAVALRALLVQLQDRARGVDPAFIAVVIGVHDEVIEWVRDGLGIGYDRWCAVAWRELRGDGGVVRFAGTELGRVRLEIGRRYRTLDVLLRRRLEQTWADVAGALATGMAPLLGDRSGAAALAHLSDLAAEAAEPGSVLRAAVGELLAARADYRTQLHPRIRPELDSLDLPEHGQQAFAMPVTGDDAAVTLYRMIAGKAERTAFQVRARLLKEAAAPGRILLTVVEQFADTLLGTEAAGREIRQLARSYRHTLWPGAFDGLNGSDAPVARVARAAEDLLAATTELAG